MSPSTTRPHSDALLADMMLLHPKLIDLSARPRHAAARQARASGEKAAARRAYRGDQRQGVGDGVSQAFVEAAGRRAHVYTSPHLVRFHERIALAGSDGVARAIDEDALVDVLLRVRAVNDGDDITQFEITTAAAFLAFSETPADVLLLEVGLGGRLDATNVIDHPALTVITPISMDHAEKARADALQDCDREGRHPEARHARASSRSNRTACSPSSRPGPAPSARHSPSGVAITTPTSRPAASSCSATTVCSICPLPALIGRHPDHQRRNRRRRGAAAE